MSRPSAGKLELLSPAGNMETAIQAILHGADAVYMGAPSHGARVSAANSLDDIRRVVDFAHIYRARVYVTVNTLVYDRELIGVEKMIGNLYRARVDALIVQDMGVLRMDLPPISLHASTQCDIRTPEKARFLEECGFSQLVLARELSIDQIREICNVVTIPVETFIHGALCVSYSGRCSAGFALSGRSGNRGECPQICRRAFTLTDSDGNVLANNKYLLSLKDLKADAYLEQLVNAGVRSFKIEGRLKETGYVKNVTSYYSRRLNELIEKSEGRFLRSSYGNVSLKFTPRLDKSFNRGFTSYFLSGKAEKGGIASLNTPKSLGEKITDITQLKPGDGISYFDKNGEYNGLLVNGVKNRKIIANKPVALPSGTPLYRTSSVEWKKLMAKETAERRIKLDITLDESGITATDEMGTMVKLGMEAPKEIAQNRDDYSRIFSKLGNTPFELGNFTNRIPERFFPASRLTSIRRELIDKLLSAGRATYPYSYRRPERCDYPFPNKVLAYSDNVANRYAERFYRDHGVKKVIPALEVQKSTAGNKGMAVMITRHCILRELGLCRKQHKIKMPLRLKSGNMVLEPTFDCDKCEMTVRTV